MEDKRIGLPQNYSIKQYKIDSILSYGGSCIVYKAHYKTTDSAKKYVLIKEIYPKELIENIKRDKEGSLIIEDEAINIFNKYISIAKSENSIIDKLRGKENNDYYFERMDSCELNNTFYSIIETRSGDMLFDIIKRNEESNSNIKPFYNSISDIIEFVLRICESTRELHKNNYMHLDLHPLNIHISTIQTGKYSNGRIARLIDFNSAKEINFSDDDEQIFTYSLGYSSDEIIKRGCIHSINSNTMKLPITFASDIFSIGAIFFRMIKGRALIQNSAPPENSSINKLQITTENEYCKNCSQIAINKLNEILYKCLNRSHIRRYQNIDGLIDDLNELLDIINNKPCIKEWYVLGQTIERAKNIEEELKGEQNSKETIFDEELIPNIKYKNKALEFLSAIKLIQNNKERHILLTGEGGSGKTTLLKYSCMKLVNSNIISLYIYIDDRIKGKLNTQNFIMDEIIDNYFNIKNPKEEDYVKLQEMFNSKKIEDKNRFILIIDGLNEIILNSKKIEIINELKHLAMISNLQIIISNRSYINGLPNNFNLVEINPLKADKINAFLNKHNIPFVNNPNLINVLSNPFMLNEFVSSYRYDNSYISRELNSEADVLDLYMQKYRESIIRKYARDEDTLNYSKTIFDYILGKFMYFMSQKGALYITKNEFIRFIKNLNLDEAIYKEDECIRVICENIGFIVYDASTDSYYVKHQIYIDFICAKYIIEEMWQACIKDTVPKILCDKPIPYYVMKYIGDILKERENIIKYPLETYLSSEYSNIIKSINDPKDNYEYKNNPHALITWQLKICNKAKNNKKLQTSIAVYNLLEILWIAREGISQNEKKALKLNEFTTTLVDKKNFPHYKNIKQLLGYKSTIRNIISFAALLIVIFTCIYTIIPTPRIEIEPINNEVITEGTSITYIFTVKSGNKVLKDIDFYSDWFETEGFNSDIKVGKYSEDGRYYIELDNITKINSTNDCENYIAIKANKFKEVSFKKNKLSILDKFTLLPKESTIYTNIIGGYKEVRQMSNVEYEVEFVSDEPLEVNLTGDQIIRNGFGSDITIEKIISQKNRAVYKVLFSNIKGDTNSICSFHILDRAAIGENSSVSYKTSSNSFKLVDYNVDMNTVNYTISEPSEKQIVNGGAVAYSIKFYSKAYFKINLDKSYIKLSGFTADIDILQNEEDKNERILLLSNIKVNSQENLNIYFEYGMAETFNGSLSNASLIAFNVKTFDKSFDFKEPIANLYTKSTNIAMQGNSYRYYLFINDDHTLCKINLSSDAIELHGFKSQINISEYKSQNLNSSILLCIDLYNIQGEIGKDKFITLKKESVSDSSGNLLQNTIISPSFELVSQDTKDSINNNGPKAILSLPSKASIKNGDRVEFKIQFFNNTNIVDEKISIMMTTNSIVLNGFNATKEVRCGVNENERIIVLSNIQEIQNTNSSKTIALTGGTACDSLGNLSKAINSSEPFYIEK